ncbi:MAG: IS3 family transposase [Casimicrobium sp.]
MVAPMLAEADIFDYIECFYNTIRRHSALDNRSPLDFTASFALNSKTNAT